MKSDVIRCRDVRDPPRAIGCGAPYRRGTGLKDYTTYGEEVKSAAVRYPRRHGQSRVGAAQVADTVITTH